MPTAKQIATIIRSTVHSTHDDDGVLHGTDTAAEQIAELFGDNGMAAAADALESEITSTLLEMLAATILATLINEEGGGRTNITFSPGSMQDMAKNWTWTAEMHGMERTVRIVSKDRDAWEATDQSPADARLGSLLMGENGPLPEAGVIGMKVQPQAERKEHKRPHWTINFLEEIDNCSPENRLLRCHDQADAQRQLQRFNPADVLAGMAHIENRWCLHPDCPACGCNVDTTLRDARLTDTEVASDAEKS